jgi:hypothetical protein
MQRLLDAAAAADMLAWVNSGFSVDASVRITLNGIQLRVYCQHLEHLLRYCARPPFALERHRHRYHGVFAPNHKLRRAVTSLAKRERRKAPRGGDRRACGRRSSHGGLL